MILAQPIHQIDEVLDNRVDWGVFVEVRVRPHVAHAEIKAYNAFRFSDRVKLSIREVAGRAANDMRAGMSSNEWSGGG